MHVKVMREEEIEPADTLGGRMQQVRMFAGFTQAHMARVIGKSTRSVKAYEGDYGEISAVALGLWAKECGVSPSDLLFQQSGWTTAPRGDAA